MGSPWDHLQVDPHVRRILHLAGLLLLLARLPPRALRAVLFAVLDHYTRRNEGQKRVIGTLLGTVDEATGAVEVTNCFAVTHSDKVDADQHEVFLDMKFQQTMRDLHARVNPKEAIVGWCLHPRRPPRPRRRRARRGQPPSRRSPLTRRPRHDGPPR